MKRITILFVLICFCGCIRNTAFSQGNGMYDQNTEAADIIFRSMAIKNINIMPRVHVSPFVNSDTKSYNKEFGLAVSEQVAGRLATHGVKVFFEKGKKPEQTAIGNPPPPTVLHLVGSYLVAGNKIFITAKIRNQTSDTVVSAHSWELPLTPETYSLLR